MNVMMERIDMKVKAVLNLHILPESSFCEQTSEVRNPEIAMTSNQAPVTHTIYTKYISDKEMGLQKLDYNN